jgi:hypothetical protein
MTKLIVAFHNFANAPEKINYVKRKNKRHIGTGGIGLVDDFSFVSKKYIEQ